MQAAMTTTLLDLVHRLTAQTTTDREVVATVAYLVNSGHVRLSGNFAGAKITFPPARSAMPRQGHPFPKEE